MYIIANIRGLLNEVSQHKIFQHIVFGFFIDVLELLAVKSPHYLLQMANAKEWIN